MKNPVWKICCLLIFATFVGCDALFTPEPERSIRQYTDTANALADAMANIKDADSARAEIDTIDRKFASLCELIVKIGALSRDVAASPPDPKTQAQLLDEMKAAASRLQNEGERLKNLPGLPTEFWKMIETRSAEFAIKSCESAPSGKAEGFVDAAQFYRNIQNLQQRIAFEQIVKVEMVNVRFDLRDKAYAKLQQLAPAATFYQMRTADGMCVVLGPVADFKAFVSSMDFGDVQFQNETKRLVRVRVSSIKLGAKAETFEEEMEVSRRESEKESQKNREEMDQRMAQSRADDIRREADRIKEEAGGDPSDPAYYDKLAETMTSGEHFKRKKAVEVLLQTSPSKVTAEQRKKIARAFKDMAESVDSRWDKEEAVKGLVIWGGKFSGAILLKMLDEAGTFEEEPFIKALGEIKYAKAAPALAAKLGDFHLHQYARKALRAMGQEAEDALIVVAPSQNADICLAAVELLGDCGTEKSLPVLRRGAASRNFRVRDASKESIRKIIARQNEAKTGSE